jgi:hypothetical protein
MVASHSPGSALTAAGPDGFGASCSGMTYDEYLRKLDELDRLLNDPDVPMEPSRVWSLLAEITRHDAPQAIARHSDDPGCC